MGKHWEMLGKPDTLEASYPDGGTNTLDMWTYWRLLEGEVYVDQPYRDARDLDPPVLHVELMNTPVVNEETGKEISDHLYVYWKNGRSEEHTSELQSLMRISYAVFCLK